MLKPERAALAVVVATVLAGSTYGVRAATVEIGSLTITGGQFEVFTAPYDSGYTSGSDIAAGYITPTWDVNAPQSTAAPGSIISFDLDGTWLNVYSASNAIQAGPANPGFPVPNGSFDDSGGTITIDLRALIYNWNGTDLNGYPASGSDGIATGTVDAAGNYNVSWAAYIAGPFNTVSNWSASGTVTAVPLPSAVWLFGSGLIGLISIARKKNA